MIFVDRPAGSRPMALDKPDKHGKTERQRAEEFFADPANDEGKFSFTAYGDDTVREALNQLFHHKCAYCESSYGATQPVAVEHWRPKGEVVVESKRQRPGYYWLAADWDNLLPSCTDCNSARYHPVPDGEPEKLGKANLFPVASSFPARLKPGDEQHEVPLLLHPCHEEPEKHLRFDYEGIALPLPDATGGEDLKGRKSIDTYGLQRPLLVQARKAHALKLRSEIDELEGILEVIAEVGQLTPRLEALYSAKLAAIHDYEGKEKVYAGMARQIVRHYLTGLGLDP